MAVRIVEEALRGNISGKVMAVVANKDLGTGLPPKGKTALACEYAKYKNRLHDFTVQV
jgi:hypothetical protein